MWKGEMARNKQGQPETNKDEQGKASAGVNDEWLRTLVRSSRRCAVLSRLLQEAATDHGHMAAEEKEGGGAGVKIHCLSGRSKAAALKKPTRCEGAHLEGRMRQEHTVVKTSGV